jgi:hypothetical protein
LIGKARVELKLEDLSELQAPGQSFVKEIVLKGGCDGTQTACNVAATAPHYIVRYEIKRLPDASGGLRVNPNP